MQTVKVAHGEKIVEASTRKKNQVQSGLKGCCLFCWRSFYFNKNFDTCCIAKSDFPFCCSKIDIWNIQTVVFKTLFALFITFWSLGWVSMPSGSTGKAMHASNKKYSMSVVFDALVLFARINFLKIEFRVPDLAFNCTPKPWGIQQDLYVCCAAAKKNSHEKCNFGTESLQNGNITK